MQGASTGNLTPSGTLFDRADEVLGFDLRKLCFEGPAEARSKRPM